ncbi:hypothetical protein [Streptacidiphilus sp. EB129]|uniref:hypothetical protein n=1 Tax=Streptacidiphilus sp. EB129 TaxID=3156262 RepID=UPI003518A65F
MSELSARSTGSIPGVLGQIMGDSEAFLGQVPGSANVLDNPGERDWGPRRQYGRVDRLGPDRTQGCRALGPRSGIDRDAQFTLTRTGDTHHLKRQVRENAPGQNETKWESATSHETGHRAARDVGSRAL